MEILLPKMGESVNEATIVEWLKQEGDAIEMDEFIVNIATDKVDNEVPSEYEGVLVKKLFKEGEVVQVGQAFAIIDTDQAVDEPVGDPNSENLSEEAPAHQEQASKELEVANISNGESNYNLEKSDSNGRFYSPLVRSIAQTEGLSMDDLSQIDGSGLNQRVTKHDILAFIEDRPNQPSPAPVKPIETAKTQAPVEAPSVTVGDNDEVIEMDRMRKLIADHMVMSKQVSPHVTSFVEADVTNMVLWRNKVKKTFLEREGTKITFTPLFIEAIVRTIKDFPMVNVSVNGSQIIKHGNINIGMATALPNGNLIVPVIKNADQMSIIGLAKKVNELADKARNNKLSPDDISGGTYTMTNMGTFGNLGGTAIINQPQVAIMAVGAIRKKPVVIETPQGDVIGIRHMMVLSHAYDHRVVDGALGGMFVKRMASYLESFDINREF